MSDRKGFWIIAGLTVTLFGCATGFQAVYDHDPAKDFGQYKYYAWISENPMKIGPSTRINNPLVESPMSRINSASTRKREARDSQIFCGSRCRCFVVVAAL